MKSSSSLLYSMCGIVGLFFKRPELEPELGQHFAPMLESMCSRGPDSAGFAIYDQYAGEGRFKLSLHHPEKDFDWSKVAASINSIVTGDVFYSVTANHSLFELTLPEPPVLQFFQENWPDITVMSAGKRIQIMKDMGTPQDVVSRFGVRKMQGSHAIGHTRMATESAVTTAGSHPFSTGMDLCLVHNGSLSNHNRLRKNLKREGISFNTENDTEVAAGYLSWRLRQGLNLKEALEQSLHDLDGFYTFAVGTSNGFAVLRDPIACKPAVMAETDDYVAMASEYRSLAELPDVEKAKLWEPEPGVVYSWSR